MISSTAQSQKIREFYKYMAREYPYLSFTFKGRIKSLIRAEAKFNGYVVEYIYDYYTKNGTYPPVSELQERLNCFRDLIAYRIVISMPKCHLKNRRTESGRRSDICMRPPMCLRDFWRNAGLRRSPPEV